MPSDDKAQRLRWAESAADLEDHFKNDFWKDVDRCLRDVFRMSDADTQKALARMYSEVEKLADAAALLFFHDSPLQVASVLAGASQRPLTGQELLAYDKLCADLDRPSREQVLEVHGVVSKAG